MNMIGHLFHALIWSNSIQYANVLEYSIFVQVFLYLHVGAEVL